MELVILLAGIVYGLIMGLIPAAGATTGLITLFGFMPYFVSDPNSSPFSVEDVIAADRARVASPLCASGKPSTMVAAAELAPGMPNSTPEKESPVVDEATTATQKITPK